MIDWEFIGLQALGEDSGHIAGAVVRQASSLAEAHQNVQSVFRGYLAGLHDVGWRGDERVVWFAFAAHFALWNAITNGSQLMAAADERLPQHTDQVAPKAAGGHGGRLGEDHDGFAGPGRRGMGALACALRPALEHD